MTVNCLWEAQKAVYGALSGDGTLAGLVAGVYSHVPQDTAYPYVRFSGVSGEDWSAKTFEGVRCSIVIDALSRGRGAKEALAIMAEIKRILHGATLSMTGCMMVDMYCTRQSVRPLSDGLTWQGSVEFGVLVQVN